MNKNETTIDFDDIWGEINDEGVLEIYDPTQEWNEKENDDIDWPILRMKLSKHMALTVPVQEATGEIIYKGKYSDLYPEKFQKAKDLRMKHAKEELKKAIKKVKQLEKGIGPS